MRCDQPMYLNKRGEKLVEGETIHLYTQTIIRTYPDGKTEYIGPHTIVGSSVKKEENIGASYIGMFDTTYPLFKYTFPDGEVYYEALQETIWSAGPMMFLALKNENDGWIQESLWTDEEMNNA